MARPQKNTVDYFPFYCEEGKKMYYLEETYGNDGFAVFMKLLRELARTDYHYLDLSKKTTLMFLSAKCKVSADILESIIKDLVDLDKFDAELWNDNKIIWCQDFVDSIQDAYAKRTNICIDKNGLLALLVSLGLRKPSKRTPKQTKCNSKDVGNPQTIVNYTKEEDIKLEKRKEEFYSLIASTIEGTIYIDKPSHVREFYEYWTEHGDKDKKMRFEKENSFSITRRLGTWWKNIDKFNPENKSAFDNF